MRARRPAECQAARVALAAIAALFLGCSECGAAREASMPYDDVRVLAPTADTQAKFLYLLGQPWRYGGTIRWRYNASNAPAAFSDAARTVGYLQAAFDQWSRVCGVSHAYAGPTTTMPGVEFPDGQMGLVPDFENVVGWGYPGTSIAGEALVSYDAEIPALIDVDMVLSTTLVSEPGGLIATATHEFGHMLGLGHSNLDAQVMSGPPNSAHTGLATLQADDIRGCRCLYGPPAGLQAPYVCSLPPSLDFGSVIAGTTSAPQPLTVTNSGNAPLTIGTISADDGQFGRASGCDPGTTLGPGASCTIFLNVRPNSSGGRAAQLVIGTSDGPYRLPMLADGVAPPPPPPIPTATMIEYYNATLDHYFATTSPGEQANLDAGNTPTRWTRTGQGYRVYPAAQVQASPLCRYYIPPALGDSHFFGRDARECSATAARNPSFVLEDAAFGYVVLPVAGTCPGGTTAVYRVFSNRADANHRYTTDRATRDRMVALGWIAEGDGPDAVAMCAP